MSCMERQSRCSGAPRCYLKTPLEVSYFDFKMCSSVFAGLGRTNPDIQLSACLTVFRANTWQVLKTFHLLSCSFTFTLCYSIPFYAWPAPPAHSPPTSIDCLRTSEHFSLNHLESLSVEPCSLVFACAASHTGELCSLCTQP